MTNPTLQATAKPPLGIPRWVLIWFIITAVIQTYDACYVLLGPVSHVGGPLSWLWAGHVLYGNYDQTYGGTHTDAWGEAQSWMNLVEVIGLVVVFCNLRKPWVAILAIIIQTATFWKTVAYFTIEAASGLAKTRHSLESGDLLGFLAIGLLPNLFWIVIPLIAMIALWRHIFRQITAAARASALPAS